MDTLGVKVGDTVQQVEKLLLAQGFKVSRSQVRPADMGLPARPVSNDYDLQNGRLMTRMTVNYGPMSGRVTSIVRLEQFPEKKYLTSELRHQLFEKYGVPLAGMQSGAPWHWISTSSGKAEPFCDARTLGAAYSSESQLKKAKLCKRAVMVNIHTDGDWVNRMEVSVTDHELTSKEWEPIVLTELAKKQADIDKAKAAPGIKL